MKYPNVKQGRFIERPNRFIARVWLDGKEEVVHVKNTGRCKELLLPNVLVGLQKAENPNRKTKWDLISVYKENTGWINIDSNACNQVAAEFFKKHNILFRQEVTMGKSRFDFVLDLDNGPMVVEVKGCTLESRQVGYFPDAPSARAVRHVKELTQMAKEGTNCGVLFVIAINDIHACHLFDHQDPALYQAIQEAKEAGVSILHGLCDVTDDSLEMKEIWMQTPLLQTEQSETGTSHNCKAEKTMDLRQTDKKNGR